MGHCMDSLQNQVTGLNTKVDALHQLVEHLSSRITEMLPELSLNAGSGAHYPRGATGGRRYSQAYSSFNAAMEHKDVLVDADCMDTEGQSGEKELAPQIQIQRLTAQLTAAYNRIAALEEQLLAQRIH